eukprot:1083129-Pleurochrysis_carterae.AAC.3
MALYSGRISDAPTVSHRWALKLGRATANASDARSRWRLESRVQKSSASTRNAEQMRAMWRIIRVHPLTKSWN